MNKLIISALLIFGLVGMIGLASAAQQTAVLGIIVDTDGNKLEGATVTIHDGLTNQDTQLGTTFTTSSTGFYYVSIGPMEIGDDVTVYAVHPTAGRGVAPTKVVGGQPNSVCNVALVDVTVPEFPTIALPIAAILGLMFIISSRKKKE